VAGKNGSAAATWGKASGAGGFVDILELCAGLHDKAAKIYRKLAKASEKLDLISFWAEMADDVEKLCAAWERIHLRAEKGRILDFLAQPHAVRKSLEEIDREMDNLEAALRGIQDLQEAFQLAYSLEFYLLSPTLEILRSSLADVSQKDLQSTNPAGHVQRFVSGFSRHMPPSFFHVALTRSLQRMVRHNRFLSEQNTTDPLTGLFNQNGFRQAILPTAMAAHRNDSTVGIMIISVDNLHDLYASLGCEEGDQLVKDLAELLRESVRLSDVLGRHSFSVFYAFFPKVKQQFLHIMASRIIQNIEIRAPWVPRATLSIGGSFAAFKMGTSYTTLQEEAEQALERLFEKATDCLHRAQLSRTNRVVIE